MKPFGQLFYRSATFLAMVLLVLVVTAPVQSTVSAQPIPTADPFQSDDFNQCTLASNWTFTSGAGLAKPTISGAFTGKSAVTLTIPAGTEATFSNKNQNSPRVMEPVSDADFEVEVKFNSPLTMPANANSWSMQGVLVRDDSTNPARWLRFDFDTDSTALKYYVGYLNESKKLQHLIGPDALVKGDPSKISPLYIDVRYTKSSGTWAFSYRAGDSDNWHTDKFTFTEAELEPLNSINFKPSAIGVFAGSTTTGSGGVAPGMTAQVDYFMAPANTSTNDNIKLTVTTNGNGTVAQKCSGINSMTLTASPANAFTSWSGGKTGTQNPLTFVMDKSYNITANFQGAVILGNKLYIPELMR